VYFYIKISNNNITSLHKNIYTLEWFTEILFSVSVRVVEVFMLLLVLLGIPFTDTIYVPTILDQYLGT